MVGELMLCDAETIWQHWAMSRAPRGRQGQVGEGRSAGSRLFALKVIRPWLGAEPNLGVRAWRARSRRAARPAICLQCWVATAAGPTVGSAR